MAAVKSRWSILILEDHPDLREKIKDNLLHLFGEAFRIEFAASICHAIAKIKQRVHEGMPYDAFWVDLYLDYFSYDNATGEIISVDSFSQIVEIDSLCEKLALKNVTPALLADKLHVDVSPTNKDFSHYTTIEKSRLLHAVLPFCLPEARSSFETLLEFIRNYLGFSDISDSSRDDENSYSMFALEWVFGLLVRWIDRPERRFTLATKKKLAGAGSLRTSILPASKDKSDHSWTIFRAWARRFYFSVAMGTKDYEDYSAVNPLLAEIKRLSPDGYPQFLVNTAYETRRRDYLSTASIWESEDLIVARDAFKAEKIDRAFIEYMFRLCSRLRRPYLILRSRRRGRGAFAVADKFLHPDFAKNLNVEGSGRVVAEDSDLRLKLDATAFYPDFCINASAEAGNLTDFTNDLRARALHDLQSYLRLREPPAIRALRLGAPKSFFQQKPPREHFDLHILTEGEKRITRGLTFDEGRWLFFEMVCRRKFPKCFLIHSTWAPLDLAGSAKDYFFDVNDILNRALKHAAVDHLKLFPPAKNLQDQPLVLRPTPSFGSADASYLAAFDWEDFGEELVRRFDREKVRTKSDSLLLESKRLLLLAEHLLSILKIRKLVAKLLQPQSFTPKSLSEVLKDCSFATVTEVMVQYMRRLEKAADLPNLIAEDYLPGIRSFLSILLCFYTLPTEEVVSLYEFWINKGIPREGTRPIEKFSAINKKFEELSFVESLNLPAQADGKSKYLYVPSALESQECQIEIAQSKSPNARPSSSKSNVIDLDRVRWGDLLTTLTSPAL